MLSKIWSHIKGRSNRYLGPQSPHLPGTLTRIGRFLYEFSAAWIGVVWYTGYVNMRTTPGDGPQIILPDGKHPVIGGPDRPGKTPPWIAGGSGSGGSGAALGTAGGNAATKNPGTGGGTNPFPGATGSRLDQGFDMTTQHLNAPDQSRIVYVNPNDSGWRGGGYIAGLLLAGPKKGHVWYMAEGLTPTVKVGQVVAQGTPVATPRANPYNGITGNIEAGWANPASPGQPLAQVVSNPPQAAWDFYNYIRSLGGPKASQTGNAGYA